MGLRSKNHSIQPRPTGTKSSSTVLNNRYQKSIDSEIELDAIERMKSNILMLDDLQSRLAFMNNELESVIGTKRRNR